METLEQWEDPGPTQEPPLFAESGQGGRCVPNSRACIRHLRLVNGLLGSREIASWLEAHLVARLLRQQGCPTNIQGSGITAREVMDLVQEVMQKQNKPPLDQTRTISLSGRECQLLEGLARGSPTRRWLTNGTSLPHRCATP